MKVLIWGGEARYRADLPHAVQSLPLELVFCPREQPLESMFPQHADTVFLFVDAIAPVDDALMDRMPGLRLIPPPIHFRLQQQGVQRRSHC